jgi:hypothetical protein
MMQQIGQEGMSLEALSRLLDVKVRGVTVTHGGG